MLGIIGLVVVTVCVIGGFLLAKGQLLVLFQPSEFIVIGGAAIGSLITATPGKLLSSLGKKVLRVFTGKTINNESFLELIKLLYELFDLGRKFGLLALEPHAESPDESQILKKYPDFLANKEAVNFLCDTLKLLIGGLKPHEMEEIMELNLETKGEEVVKFPAMLQKIGDALPGLGIVAAVLGIIITMGHMSEGAETVGHHVAAALVGTFLGVLLSYGFVQPIASNLELQGELELQYLACIKHGLSAFAKGNTATISVEFSRRVIFSDYRPAFEEVEEVCKSLKQSV